MNTRTTTVEQDSAVDMIGPYLSTSVDCPFCGRPNVFVFMESYAGPLKVVEVCGHIAARTFDGESGNNRFEFIDPSEQRTERDAG